MPYGIKLATGLFQRHMTNILCNIPRTVVRVGDILVSGINDEDHLNYLDSVFEFLEKDGAKVNRKECSFFAPNVEYISFIISKSGISTNPDKIAALLKIPVPKNIKEPQSYIGGITYYERFIHSFMSTIGKPLYELLQKEHPWEWTVREQIAFDSLNNCLSETPVLCLYDLQL